MVTYRVRSMVLFPVKSMVLSEVMVNALVKIGKIEQLDGQELADAAHIEEGEEALIDEKEDNQ